MRTSIDDGPLPDPPPPPICPICSKRLGECPGHSQQDGEG